MVEVIEIPRIRKNSKVAFRQLRATEGGVLLHLGSGSYHGLNPIGALIWELIDGEPTFDDLVAQLRSQLEEPPRSLELEVAAFLDALRERKLID